VLALQFDLQQAGAEAVLHLRQNRVERADLAPFQGEARAIVVALGAGRRGKNDNRGDQEKDPFHGDANTLPRLTRR
jgi:hypothetical protein